MSPIYLGLTSKTFMKSSMAVTEMIGVKSSTTNIRPKTDTSKANPHSMEANLKVKMKISEKSEEGNYQHSGVSTESPQRVLRRGIYQRLLPHNQGHHQQQQQQHNGGWYLLFIATVSSLCLRQQNKCNAAFLLLWMQLRNPFQGLPGSLQKWPACLYACFVW